MELSLGQAAKVTGRGQILGAGATLIAPHAPRVPRVTLDRDCLLQAAAQAFAAGEIDRGELMRRISISGEPG
jgi:hypothetical protein